MPTSILNTKLHIPKTYLDDLVVRPRLIKRLNQGWQRPLTLIAAPAGFGKTTLVSDWLNQFPLTGNGFSRSPKIENRKYPKGTMSKIINPQVAWLSLDEADNDPLRFFDYLLAALRRITPKFGQASQELRTSAQKTLTEPLMTALINDLTLIERPLILVLDDYHLIESPAIHAFITFLLDQQPQHIHLFILTRVDPPLPLAKLRAQGQITEIRTQDLSFDLDETKIFFRESMALNLGQAAINTLNERTEGWVAGLQLAALSLRGRSADRAADFIKAFGGSHRHVIDYLLVEVLHQQQPEVRTFLTQTAILGRLNADLCQAVTGLSQSQTLLHEIEAANLFLIPLDDQRHWYRYHHLFAEFLQTRLQSEDQDRAADLHRRASHWYEVHQMWTEAIDHALKGADYDRAAQLVAKVSQDLLLTGELTTLHRWLEALPEASFETYPQLHVFHAWTLFFDGHIKLAQQTLTRAAAHSAQLQFGRAGGKTDKTALHSHGSAIAIQSLISLLQGDVEGSIALSQEALDHIEEYDLFSRGLIALMGSMPYMVRGDLLKTEQAVDRVIALGQETNNQLVSLLAHCQKAEIQYYQGHLRRSAETYRRTLKLAAQTHQTPGLIGMAHGGLGLVLTEWNKLDAAETHLQKGLDLSREWGESASFDIYLYLTRLYLAQNNPSAAYEAMDKVVEFLQTFMDSRLNHRLISLYQARLALIQGDLASAASWVQQNEARLSAFMHHLEAQQMRDLPMSQVYHFEEYEKLVLARFWIFRGQGQPHSSDLEDALYLLDTLRQPAADFGRMSSAIEILTLQALAYQEQRHLSLALTKLEQALSLAEPEGYVRFFLELKKPMVRLLQQAQVQGIFPDYIAALLEAFPEDSFLPVQKAGISPGPSSISPGQTSPPLIEPLTDRELEILALIASGLSNNEIADSLTIAMGTVKKHINNVYAKLDVHSRTQAVARAKEAGLL